MAQAGHLGELKHTVPGGRSSLSRVSSRFGPQRLVAATLICIVAPIAITAHLAEVTQSQGGSLIELVELACLTAIALIAGFYVIPRAVKAEGEARHAVQDLNLEKVAAQAANTAKSNYLASISHEIRAPLNAIYGYAQLMEIEGTVSPREAARIIRRSAEHLTSLVDGLLDISQIENGVMRLKHDVVHLRDFLDQIFWMMRPAAQSKRLTFQTIFPEHLPEYVRMDHSRLRQVLINLLSNAIKYTDSGSVTFKVGYVGQIAVFEIIDTGPGISAEDRERIFDPYERGDADGHQSQQGIGLGLPIARAITQILGGELELVDDPAPGSRFRVTVMLGSVAGLIEGQQALRNIVGYEGPRRSALVVDDDMRQLSFLRSLLEAVGFEVVAVPNGETAVTLCAGRKFDFALLDISMPGMSGWDVAAHLREYFGQDIHIIMLSANTAEFHKPQTAEPVHDLFLIKPFEFGALLEAIGGMLKLSWKWETADVAAAPALAQRSDALSEAAWIHVGRLKQLLQIGHVRAIEAEIAALCDAAPEADTLVRELYSCLDRFDLAAMTKRLADV
jgi:signal transduction histidine kinase/FixJ family two-component response regulator